MKSRFGFDKQIYACCRVLIRARRCDVGCCCPFIQVKIRFAFIHIASS